MLNNQNNTFTLEDERHTLTVNGTEYVMTISDDLLPRFIAVTANGQEAIQRYSNLDFKKATLDEIEENLNVVRREYATVLDTLLHDGAFDELYELSGRNVVKLMPILEYLIDIVKDYNERTTSDKVKTTSVAAGKYARKR